MSTFRPVVQYIYCWSSVVSLSQIVLPILGSLHFYMELKINLLIFAKKKKKNRLNFDRHCIEPVDQFEDCWHLNNIKSSNEQETSFHLLSFSLIYFNLIIL